MKGVACMLPVLSMFGEGGTVTAAGAVSNLLDIGSTCLTWIMNNAFLSVVFAGCLVPVAFKVIKAAKRAAR